ncbi:MAG: hypothetical protein WKF35_11640 [Ferruginibacter sp.]
MKPQNLLPILALGFSLIFTSCKKEESTPAETSEIETTFALTADQAIADNLTEDANEVMLQVSEEKELTGNFAGAPPETTNNFLCAIITVTPQNSFPKTVVIDFGTGCTAPNGVTRRGIIRIVISDSLKKSGSVAVMTFDNYYVNNFKKEGTITWTNTSTTITTSWRREVVNGKITAPNGRFWLHSGIREIVQTHGVSSPRNPIDDIYSITGNSTVTNANGRSRTTTILEPLQKKFICKYIDRGRIKIQGPNHFAILDFGNGQCDNEAIISIDGQAPHTITLP